MSWGAGVLLLVPPLSFIWAALNIRELFPRWDWKYDILKKLEAFFRKYRTYLAWAMVLLSVVLGIYTGILFSAFNGRPLWNTSILGPLFLVSGMSGGAAAIVLALLLHALKTRGIKPVLAAAMLLIACYPLPKIAQAAYEKRIGTEFGAGYPMSAWMAMGMRKSWMAAGWYNEYSKEMYHTYGTDLAAIGARNRKDMQASLKAFADHPADAYAFYQEKFASQWNESTFESLWIAITCEPYGGAERPKLAESLYDGRWPGVALEKEMDYALQVLYAGFALGLVVLLRKRESGQMIFPVLIAGGILFHLLFEANAKYALTYLPMFAPVAAYGILTFGVDAKRWFVRERVSGGKADV